MCTDYGLWYIRYTWNPIEFFYDIKDSILIPTLRNLNYNNEYNSCLGTIHMLWIWTKEEIVTIVENLVIL